MSIVELEKLIVDDIRINIDNFYIEENQKIGIYGDNTLERTELIKTIFGISECRERKVKVFGEDINKKRKHIYNNIGFAFKDILDSKLKVDRIFKIHSSYYKNLTKPAVEDIMYKFYLNSYKKDRVKNLNNFMKSKLAIAVSVLNNPEILVYDGVFDGLGEPEREELKSIIASVSDGKTLILSSGSLEDLMDTTDVIYEVREGELNAIYGN